MILNSQLGFQFEPALHWHFGQILQDGFETAADERKKASAQSCSLRLFDMQNRGDSSYPYNKTFYN